MTRIPVGTGLLITPESTHSQSRVRAFPSLAEIMECRELDYENEIPGTLMARGKTRFEHISPALYFQRKLLIINHLGKNQKKVQF
jgi:hypothetical protein